LSFVAEGGGLSSGSSVSTTSRPPPLQCVTRPSPMAAAPPCCFQMDRRRSGASSARHRVLPSHCSRPRVQRVARFWPLCSLSGGRSVCAKDPRLRAPPRTARLSGRPTESSSSGGWVVGPFRWACIKRVASSGRRIGKPAAFQSWAIGGRRFGAHCGNGTHRRAVVRLKGVFPGWRERHRKLTEEPNVRGSAQGTDAFANGGRDLRAGFFTARISRFVSPSSRSDCRVWSLFGFCLAGCLRSMSNTRGYAGWEVLPLCAG